MDYKIVEKPAFKIVGMKYFGNNSDGAIGGLCQEFYTKRIHTIKNRLNVGTAYGYDTWTSEINETGKFTYIVGVEVSDDSDVPEDMVYVEVPGNKYAVFLLENLTDGSVQEVYRKLMPEYGLEVNGNYDFEFYETEDKDAPAHFHVPIK